MTAEAKKKTAEKTAAKNKTKTAEKKKTAASSTKKAAASAASAEHAAGLGDQWRRRRRGRRWPHRSKAEVSAAGTRTHGHPPVHMGSVAGGKGRAQPGRSGVGVRAGSCGTSIAESTDRQV